MIAWNNRLIIALEPNEVFVFGSNATGFHGAGTAGLACRGDARNNWRQDQWFLAAIARRNSGVGKWAVFGQDRGWQQGTQEQAFAVQTVTRPGAKRSVSRRDIYYQLVELWKLADQKRDCRFLITPLGEGYAGYNREEMNEVWEFLISQHGTRNNIKWIRLK